MPNIKPKSYWTIILPGDGDFEESFLVDIFAEGADSALMPIFEPLDDMHGWIRPILISDDEIGAMLAEVHALGAPSAVPFLMYTTGDVSA